MRAMQYHSLKRMALLAGALVLAGGLAARAQTARTISVRPLAEGLRRPHGVAIHPKTGDIYVSEHDSGQIGVLRNGRLEPALQPGWTVSSHVPRWAISDQMPLETWLAAKLEKPGPIAIASNGTLYVAEQIPLGRLLEFHPDEDGRYSEAIAVPVPWLDQEYQWRNLLVDSLDRLYVAGSDEIGSDFMKLGSVLMREAEGDWWVIDFGPFANFSTLALSEREDVLVVGDHKQGRLTWWEVNRHIMLGGAPETMSRATLQALSVFPDGTFILGQVEESGQASLKRIDPFSFQQSLLADGFKSFGTIAIDRENVRYIISDPVAGRVLEGKPDGFTRFNEVAMRQLVRSVDSVVGTMSEAPAFMASFFDRLQGAMEDMPDDSTHAVQFNLSDIAGKMPIVAGRIQAVLEVEDAEDDPIEQVEFFLLFPSKVVMTEVAVTPSMSFFSARRKSGKIEQTRPLFQGGVDVYRLSATNMTRLVSAPGGLHVPIVVCGMEEADGGVYVNLSFLGAGVYGDYYLSLFQGPREQRGKLMVKSGATESGNITYEASFMDEVTVEGAGGTVTREQISNLMVAGFGSSGRGVNRSVGWMRLGQFPASMTVAFGDTGGTTLTGAASDMRSIMEKKRVEMSLETASEIDVVDSSYGGEIVTPAPETGP